MRILNNFKQFLQPTCPIALTIGNFDGVHLGHQALLHRLKERAPHTVIFTFSNHPQSVLQKTSIAHLTTLAHRLALFEKIGIDDILITPFTEEFSAQTAQAFLRELKEYIPFSYLVLGHDAVIGCDRNRNLFELSEKLGFTLEYLQPFSLNGKVISSSEIRKCIREGRLAEAGTLLGRPYSIFASVQHGQGKGGFLGFHTANLAVAELALPPLGVYAVEVKIDQERILAVANLGHAPTLHTMRPPYLEVHLIDKNRDLYGKDLEVFFLKYLRPEKRFETIDALRLQIQKDIHCMQELKLNHISLS